MTPSQTEWRSDATPAGANLSALQFGRERLRFRLIRSQRRLRTLDIDPYVEQVDWERSSSVRTGELNFRRPLTGLQAAAILKGDEVRCDIDLHGNGKWKRLWQLTVATPDQDIITGTMSLALRARLKAMEESKASFRFRDDNATQITRAVAQRFQVKLGRVPQAKHTIDKLTRKKEHPIDVVTAAWKEERKVTGRRFDVDISRGVLDVTELVESSKALVIGPAITGMTQKMESDDFASAVVVTSSRESGGKKHKIRVKVVDQDRVRRFGYIVVHHNKPNLKSEAAARVEGKRYLAHVSKPKGQVSFSHPGLPFLDRGDPIRLQIPEARMNYIAWIVSTRHALSAGSYTMDVTATFADPWVDARKERVKAKKKAAAAKRKRAGADTTGSAIAPKAGSAAWRSGT